MANQVIFSGAPSQACNLPALLKGAAVMAMIGAIHVCAAHVFPLQWPELLVQAGAVLIGVSFPFVKTAFTRIVIDTARITWTQGILREVSEGFGRVGRNPLRRASSWPEDLRQRLQRSLEDVG